MATPQTDYSNELAELREIDTGFKARMRWWVAVYLVVWMGMLAVFAYLIITNPAQASSADTAQERAKRYKLDVIREAHGQWGLDAPVAAIAAQIHAESGWNTAALNPSGAAGLGQFVPSTASWWCRITGIASADCRPHNPVWAIRAVVGYDKYLWGQVKALAPAVASRGEFDHLWATMRAYNGGLGAWLGEVPKATSSTRPHIDAACGAAKRLRAACRENLAYPYRVIVELQPHYLTWGHVTLPPPSDPLYRGQR